MADIAIPPATFNNLYHHYRTGAPPGGFLSAVLTDKAFLSAAQADPTNRLHLADIILFNHWAKKFGYLREIMDKSAFDLKWEAWRIRFSPQATEIELDMGDDE
jgi:hypothetical protein